MFRELKELIIMCHDRKKFPSTWHTAWLVYDKRYIIYSIRYLPANHFRRCSGERLLELYVIVEEKYLRTIILANGYCYFVCHTNTILLGMYSIRRGHNILYCAATTSTSLWIRERSTTLGCRVRKLVNRWVFLPLRAAVALSDDTTIYKTVCMHR